MKSTTTPPVLAGKFKLLFVLFFLSFFSSVIEAEAAAEPVELTHGKIPKIKLPRLFKIGKPYVQKINFPTKFPRKLRENTRKLRDNYKRYIKNYKNFVRMPYPIFKEPAKKWDINEIVRQEKSQSNNLPISQPSENGINNLPIAEPSQISIVASPPTTKQVIFKDEPKQTSYYRREIDEPKQTSYYRREKTIVAPFIPGPPLIDRRQFDKKFEEPQIITHYNVPFEEDSGSFTVGSHYSVGNSNSNFAAAQSPRQSRNIVHETSLPKSKSLQNNIYGRGLLNNFVPSPVDDVHLDDMIGEGWVPGIIPGEYNWKGMSQDPMNKYKIDVVTY